MNKADVKAWVKKSRRSHSLLPRTAAGLIYLFWNTLLFIKGMCTDPMFRAVNGMRIFRSGAVHQTTPLTFPNRFPEVFSECARYFGDRTNLRILSFGCSTGEEVLTLREYFPTAEIVGADINKRCLSVCAALEVDEKISFVYATPKRLKQLGMFDAIFCMAVFQRTPQHIADADIRDLSKIYAFEKFENQITVLRDMLTVGGLLVVHFTQYSLEDTCVAHDFTAYGDCTQEQYGSPVFDKNSIRLDKAAPWHSIYRKKS